MKKSLFTSVLALVFLLLASCSNSNDNDLGPPPPPPNNVTYTGNVKAIIDGNCLNCHTSPPVNGAPMSLTTYNDVKDAVQNRGLLDRIQRVQGSAGFMPNGGSKLSEAQIQAIKDWQTGGFIQ